VTSTAKGKVKLSYSMITFLLTLCLIAQNRIERLRYDAMNRFQAGEVGEIIAMIDEIVHAPTLKDLMHAMQTQVPRMFRFERSTVMFEDPERR
jgi:hypothetical protein